MSNWNILYKLLLKLISMLIWILLVLSFFGNNLIRPHFEGLFDGKGKYFKYLFYLLWFPLHFGAPLVIVILLYNNWELSKINIFILAYAFSTLISRFDLIFIIELFKGALSSINHLLFEQVEFGKELDKLKSKSKKKTKIKLPFIDEKMF